MTATEQPDPTPADEIKDQPAEDVTSEQTRSATEASQAEGEA